ncbi:chloride channel protein [Chloropicon primus]|uniref:Chloride channel protein n=1 Tax=Chloropicon primus TaxID=1764295 RepID=A0A5B8MMZ2_9CHLO|nr:chloride channel protein [Chloropicon primus]UPR00862.1 chloride channel protein [Chloropicon primus]|eukprot:QDZ21651.1 chloride channel protein [Chloropicon primus]
MERSVMREPLLDGQREEDEERETLNPLSSSERWNSNFEGFPASSNIMLPEKIHIFPTSYNSSIKTKQMHAGESLDFETIHSEVRLLNSTRKLVHKKFYGYTGTTLVKYLVTIGTGLFTGACAYAIAQSSSWLIDKRVELASNALERDDLSHLARLLYGYGMHAAFSMSLVIVPGLLVQFFTPQAVGAGVSLVMAYLNGNHIPYLLHYHVMATKILGTICACASGLPLGPEGPMVQIGASVGSTLTYCGCVESASGCCLCDRRRSKRSFLKSSRFDLKSSRTKRRENKVETFCEQIKLQDDADHREIISAGAAAGLAAAFGSPIGGVMFSWEEASSFWSRKVTWRCFLCTAIAVLTLALLRGSASIGLLSFPDFSSSHHPDMHMEFVWNFPFLTLTAIAAGLIGAFFNHLRGVFGKIRPRVTSPLYRMIELLLTTASCIGVMYMLSCLAGSWGGCIDKPKSWPDDFGMKFLCKEEGQINDLYTLFFSNPDEVIDRIFGAGNDECSDTVTRSLQFRCTFTLTSLALHSLTYLLFMSYAAGLAIPGGLFMPCIMVGASFGLLVGAILEKLLPTFHIVPSMYALVGGTAVLGGVFRASISLVVIVVEGTRQINFIFQVILAVVMSNWVAHNIHSEGVYESDLEKNGTVSFLRSEPSKQLHVMSAEQIMSQTVATVHEVESVDRLLHLLKYTRHNGFPVISKDTERLEGLILRSQIIVMLHRRAFCGRNGKLLEAEEETEELQNALDHEMQTFHQRQGLWERHAWSEKESLQKLEIEGEIMHGINESLRSLAQYPDVNGPNSEPPGARLFLNFRPYMNMAPLSVRRECSASRAHSLFTAMGLRHLCVVNGENKVVGVITRKDLDHASGSGWWRQNRLGSVNALQPVSGYREL